jgi:hypothetical protein
MKISLGLVLMLFGALLLLLMPVFAFAGAGSDIPGLPANPSEAYNLLMPVVLGIGFVLVGYISHLVPGIGGIKDTLVRIVAFVIVTGAGLIHYGVADFWQVAAGYFLSHFMYLFAFKGFLGKTTSTTLPASPEVTQAKKDKMNGHG